MKSIKRKLSLFIILGLLVTIFSSMSYKCYASGNEDDVVIHGAIIRVVEK